MWPRRTKPCEARSLRTKKDPRKEPFPISRRLAQRQLPRRSHPTIKKILKRSVHTASKPPLLLARRAEQSTDVGDASESASQHLLRHSGGKLTCSRCRYYRFGPVWAATHGSFEDKRGWLPVRCVWLEERPVHLRGVWGLGCNVCATNLARAAAATRGNRRLCTKFARYDVVNVSLQAEQIRQHAATDVHKVAVATFFQPHTTTGGTQAIALQKTRQDDDRLRGGVPQPQDWLNAWTVGRGRQSWANAARTAHAFGYSAQIRGQPVNRKGFQRMLDVMREVSRETKRQWLRSCECIALLLDDRQGVCLVRFKCDSSLNDSHYARRGVLCAFDTMHGLSLDKFAEDYAETFASLVDGAISRFCVNLSHERDDALYKKICSSTRSLTIDGALVKTASVLKSFGYLSNLVLVLRDAAHFIRSAIKDPIARTGGFHVQHERLFGKAHGLLKSISFSAKLKAKLEACQKYVLGSSGCAQLSLDKVMTHFNFAPHRFESFIEPRRKYACILVAVALLLADIAEDDREDNAKRQRAVAALNAMTPDDLLRTGLVGDYGEIGVRFMRKYDVNDKDPTSERRDLDEYRDLLKKLFTDCYILCAPESPERLSVPSLPAKTITQIVMDQCELMPTIWFGNRTETTSRC